MKGALGADQVGTIHVGLSWRLFTRRQTCKRQRGVSGDTCTDWTITIDGLLPGDSRYRSHLNCSLVLMNVDKDQRPFEVSTVGSGICKWRWGASAWNSLSLPSFFFFLSFSVKTPSISFLPSSLLFSFLSNPSALPPLFPILSSFSIFLFRPLFCAFHFSLPFSLYFLTSFLTTISSTIGPLLSAWTCTVWTRALSLSLSLLITAIKYTHRVRTHL